MFRMPRRNRLALALIFSAVPACAFWDLGHWSDRADATDAGSDGEGAPDGSSDAGDASATDGGGPTGCALLGDASLFCDDFETTSVRWDDDQVSDACAIGVIALDGGYPPSPSPPHVFFAQSFSDAHEDGFAYREKIITGSFDGISASYSVYVDQTDDVGVPAIQEVGIEEASGNRRLRTRIWLTPGRVRLDTAVTSPDLAATTYDENVISVPVTPGAWHRLTVTLSRTPSPGYVSLVVDGTVEVDRRPVQDGAHITAPLPRMVLRNGIRYFGMPPANQAWRILLDDVSIGRP